jgi:hypothetical protein
MSKTLFAPETFETQNRKTVKMRFVTVMLLFHIFRVKK